MSEISEKKKRDENTIHNYRLIILVFNLGDSTGDICDDDWDMDKVPNYLDNCPNNSKIFSTDFR